MDYEKKYKDAFEKAKEVYNRKDATDGGKLILESMFPELKDSEDERIRKALIKVFSNREKYLIDQSFGDITVSEALVWLEKQGENSPILSNSSNIGKDKKNPAWNGADEAGFGDALWAIEQARSIAKDENDMGNLWYAERWLKSIKERMKGE